MVIIIVIIVLSWLVCMLRCRTLVLVGIDFSSVVLCTLFVLVSLMTVVMRVMVVFVSVIIFVECWLVWVISVLVNVVVSGASMVIRAV